LWKIIALQVESFHFAFLESRDEIFIFLKICLSNTLQEISLGTWNTATTQENTTLELLQVPARQTSSSLLSSSNTAISQDLILDRQMREEVAVHSNASVRAATLSAFKKRFIEL
jgi:hypothetical protein